MNARFPSAISRASRVTIGSLILFSMFYGFPCRGQSDAGPTIQSVMHDALSLSDYREVQIIWNMQGESQAFLNEGINALREENYEGAVDQLTRALKADPKASVVYYFRAMAWKRLQFAQDASGGGRPGKKSNRSMVEAARDLSSYLEATPGDREGTLELCKALIYLSDSKKVVKELRQFIDSFPKDARGPYYLALAYLNINAMDAAIKALKQSNAVDATFTSGLTQLGVIELVDKKPKQAEVYFDRVLDIDSMQLTARVLRFAIRIDQDRVNDAWRDIDFLIRYNPTSWKFKLNRAYLEIDMGLYDQAFNDLRPALEATHVSESNFVGKQTTIDRRIDVQNAGNYLLHQLYGFSEENRTVFRKAYCLMIIGKYPEARGLLEAQKSLGETSCLHYLSAICLEHEQSYIEARLAYQRALERDADIFDANKKCGIIYTSEGKWKQSLQYFMQLERLNPDYLQTYNLRGVVYFNLKDYPKAIADFSRFLEQDTTNHEVYYNRGMSYQRLGKDIPALADLVRSGEFKEINMKSLLEEINQLIQKGDTVGLKRYSNLVMKIPSRTGLGIELEVIKIKLMQVERNWEFIDDRYYRLILKRIGGDNPGYISYTLSAKASQCLEAGDLKKARDLLDKSLSYDSKNSLAYLERGMVWIKMAQREKALEDLILAASMGNQRAADLAKQLTPK